MEAVTRKIDFARCFMVESTRSAGGLCLLWDKGVVMDVFSDISLHFDAWVTWGDREKCRITGIYGWFLKEEKHRTLSLINWLYKDEH